MNFNRKTSVIISFGVLLIATVFFILSHALPTWGVFRIGFQTKTIGLWRACDPVGSIIMCGTIICTPSYATSCLLLTFAKVFSIIGCICCALSTLALPLFLLPNADPNRQWFKLIKGAPIGLCLTTTIGLALGIAFVYTSHHVMGAAAILAILGNVFQIVGGILALTIR